MNEMSKQMELFDEGGLMQEGGTVDPVSGNDVPVGSTQEEVRDDIPAQLSEGEFVMPADVVRYHGLDKMMALRDEAKMGLQRMDDMGQMGNSEEAIIPDGVPFGMDDLEIEDDGEPQEFNLGGVVQAPGTGISGYTPPSMTTTGYTPPPVGTAVAPVVPGSQPQVAFTPVTATTNIPTFGQFIGTGGGKYDELVTYVNDAGQIMQIPHVNGKPIYPVPEGFKKQTDAPGTAPDSTIVDTTTVTPQQQQDDGGDIQDYGGGTSLLTGEKIAGYSPEEIKTGVASAKDRYAIDGDRGFDLLNILPGGSLIKSLMPDSVSASIFAKDPTYTGRPDDALMDKQQTAREELQQSLGTRITGYVGFQKGDLDPNSGGFFDKNGIAVDPRTGDQSKNESGTMNYASFSDFRKAFSAGSKSGWRGGKLGATSYSNLSDAAKSKYNKFASIMGYTDHREMSVTERAKNKNEAAKKEEAEQARRASVEKEMRESGMLTSSRGKASIDTRYSDADFGPKSQAQADRDDEAGFDNRGGGRDDAGNDGDSGTSSGNQGGGYGGGTDCLTEDMKVKLNGVIDFVTNIKVGDMIDSYKVKEVLHKHMRSGYYAINNELKISNDHPVLANGTWTRPENLVVGDSINGIPVASLEYVERMTPTVSIVIDGESFDVHTENNIYTVHGRYREVRQEAA